MPDNRKTHSLCSSPFYRIWWNIVERCNNSRHPRYYDYGGRGIGIGWKSFECFASDMREEYEAHKNLYGQENTYLGRKDINKDFSKNNCSFMTSKELLSNRRSSKYLTFNGKTKTMKEWAESLNIPYDLLRMRIYRGWNAADALK